MFLSLANLKTSTQHPHSERNLLTEVRTSIAKTPQLVLFIVWGGFISEMQIC